MKGIIFICSGALDQWFMKYMKWSKCAADEPSESCNKNLFTSCICVCVVSVSHMSERHVSEHHGRDSEHSKEEYEGI